jgi:hypothetical protein
MSDDLLRTKWAKDARALMEQAIEGANLAIPAKAREDAMRIVWGCANQEAAQREKRKPTKRRLQRGLLSWEGDDFELTLSGGNYHQLYPKSCDVELLFPGDEILPLEPNRLFNVLQCCADNVSFCMFPDVEAEQIVLWGVQTELAVEALTGRTLYDALIRLQMSRTRALDYLIDGEGEDYWSM